MNDLAIFINDLSRIEKTTGAENLALARRVVAGRQAQAEIEARETTANGIQRRGRRFAGRAALERQVADGKAARRELVERNIFLVYYFAKRFVGKLTVLELVNEGWIALDRACDKYDPERGVAFSTYAGNGIVMRLRSVIREWQRQHAVDGGTGYFQAADDGDDSEDHKPDLAGLPAPERDEPFAFDEREMLGEALRERLNGSDREVLVRWSEGETYQAIADGRGVCKERVRQIRGRALDAVARRCKRAFAADGLEIRRRRREAAKILGVGVRE